MPDEDEVPIEAEDTEPSPQRGRVLAEVVFRFRQIALSESGAVIGNDGRAGFLRQPRGQRVPLGGIHAAAGLEEDREALARDDPEVWIVTPDVDQLFNGLEALSAPPPGSESGAKIGEG